MSSTTGMESPLPQDMPALWNILHIASNLAGKIGLVSARILPWMLGSIRGIHLCFHVETVHRHDSDWPLHVEPSSEQATNRLSRDEFLVDVLEYTAPSNDLLFQPNPVD